jgi:hypothetical protein
VRQSHRCGSRPCSSPLAVNSVGEVPLTQRHDPDRRSWASRSPALPARLALMVPLAQRYEQDPRSRAVPLAGRRARPALVGVPLVQRGGRSSSASFRRGSCHRQSTVAIVHLCAMASRPTGWQPSCGSLPRICAQGSSRFSPVSPLHFARF